MKKTLLLLITCTFFLFANAVQLNGTYTIDPSSAATTTNFKNVQSAFNYITGNSRTDGGPNNSGLVGLSGPVIFNMTPGSYPEYIQVPGFSTSSTTNTITFQKLPLSSGEVIFNRSVSTSLAIFDMSSKSGKNLIFKNLVFQPIVTSTSNNLSYMVGNGINLAFDNCKFDLRSVANRSIYGIYNSDGVVVTNCTFYNSFGTTLYQGAATNGVTALSMSNSVIQNTGFNATGVGIIENNSFTQCAIGINNNGFVAGAFRNNILVNATLAGSVTSSNQPFIVENNKINISRRYFPDNYISSIDDISHPLYFSALPGNSVTIRNNFISWNQSLTTNNIYGIFVSGYANTINVYHNTVSMNSTQPNTIAISSTSANVKNNIFSNSGGGKAQAGAVGSGGVYDYNNYFSLAAIGYDVADAHATKDKVNFLSPTDLHHTNGCLIGTNVGVSNDIDGLVRSTTSPILGATEATNAGLDAALAKIISPNALVYTPGTSTQAISFQVKNRGGTTISSITANYTINNGAPISETFSGLSIAGCDSANLSFTNNFSFPQGNTNLQLNIATVNGVADNDANNNSASLRVDIYGPMHGIYTVNPVGESDATNFRRIGEADSAMVTRTIDGPVIIKIFSGTYTQNGMTLNNVPGSSVTNTITFTSFANDSLSVNINSPFEIKNNANIFVTKLKFSSTITISENSSSISISNCNITARVSYTGGNNFYFVNNRITGGVQVTGYNNSSINNILVKGNTMSGGGFDGNGSPFLLQYFGVVKPVIEGNIFSNFNFVHTSGSYAYKSSLYFVGCTDTLTLRNNQFLNCTTSRLIGNFDTYPITTGRLSHVEMYNNFISSNGNFTISTSDLSDGVGVVQSLRYYYNNFYNTAASGDATFSFGYAGTYVNGVSYCKNNIFASKNNATAYSEGSQTIGNKDYNDFYTNGPNLIAKSGVGYYTSFAAYKAAGNEPNGKNVNPKYITDVDLHVQHPGLLAAGTPAPSSINSLLTDIDNDIRNQLNPCIGADEFMPPSNDVIAVALLTPRINFSSLPGSDLKIQIKNNGSAPLTQVKIRYSINNVDQLPSYVWTGNLAYDSSTVINFGNFAFPMLQYSTLKVFTDLPNGAPDMMPFNDTLRLDSIMPYANGEFTLGGVAPTFPNFTPFSERLSYGGVDGAVNVKIRDGKYTEQAKFKFVRGASASNQIIFRGENNNAALDTLTFSSLNSGVTTTGTLRLDSAAFFTFKHITIQSQSLYSTELYFYNKNHDITIDSCLFTSAYIDPQYAHIEAPRAYNYNIYPIDSNLVFTNNTIEKGSLIALKLFLHKGIIKGNKIYKSGSQGDYSTYAIDIECNTTGVDLIIDSNLVQYGSYCSYLYLGVCYSTGITNTRGLKVNCSFPNPKITISRNQIYTNQEAFSLNATGNGVGGNVKVFNNFFKGRGSFASISAPYSEIYNNTFADSSENSNGAIVGLAGSNITFSNNIVSSSIPSNTPMANSTSAALSISAANITSLTATNNAYYNTDSARIFSNGSSRYSLKQWQIFYGKEQNSKIAIPAIKTYLNDLHIDKNSAGASKLYQSALPVAYITTDVDNEARSTTKPSIGADEFTLNNIDAGISLVNGYPIPLASGVSPVKVSLSNYGSNPITSAQINWTVNGALQTPYSFTGNVLTGDSAANINIGNFNFTGTGFAIVAWTSLPNGTVDESIKNDTARNFAYPSLCGNYTVGGVSPDFPTIKAAANYAYFAGVTCPVVFNIRDGVYNESDTIRLIQGTSAINTVTFQSESLDSSKVSLVQSAGFEVGVNAVSVLAFDNAQFVRFNEITIARTAASTGYYNDVVILRNNINDVQITNCKIVSTGPGFAIANQQGQGLTGQGLTLKNNLVLGGSRVIYISGTGNTPATRFQNVNVSNNQFLKPLVNANYYPQIGFAYLGNTEFNNNIIDSSISSIETAGLSLQFCEGKISVLSNVVRKRKALEGITLVSVRGLNFADSAAIIANNFVITDSASTAGINAEIGSNVKILYNSIDNNSASGTGIYLNNNNNNGTIKDTVANNIIVNRRGGYCILYQGSSSLINFSNNDLYAISPAQPAFLGSTGYATIATIPTNGGTTQLNNVSINPLFVSPGNLHIGEQSLKNAGKPFSVVLNDIDGDVRSLTASTIGADELVLSNNDAGVQDIVSPILPFAAGTNPVSVIVRNFGASTLTTAQINWTVDGVLQTPFAYSGAIAGNSTALIQIGTFNFLINHPYTIKAWTSLPNGSTDAQPLNDTTMRSNIYPALSGTYTIGGAAPDFQNFGPTTQNLKFGGVLGNVVFNARDGRYNETMRLDSIPFQNNYTILYQSESQDSSKVTLYYTATQLSPQSGLLHFDKSKNITINKLGFEVKLLNSNGYSAPHKSIVYLSTYNKNLSFTNNLLVDSTYSDPVQTSNLIGTRFFYNTDEAQNNPNLGPNSLDSNISITKNRMVSVNNYASAAINISGRSHDNYGNLIIDGWLDKIVVDNNVFRTTNKSRIAVNIQTAKITSVSGNDFDGGISIAGADNIQFNKNNIYHEGNSSTAVYINGGNNRAAGKPLMISNNMILTKRVGTFNAIIAGNTALSVNGDRANLLHNTLVTTNPIAVSNYGGATLVFLTNSTTDTLKNNVFYNKDGGAVFSFNNVPNIVSDYNDYVYSTSIAANALNLTQYKNLFGQDANSKENIDPLFRGPKDLHASNIKIKVAPTLANVSTDIDNQSRGAITCIGADEFLQPANDIVLIDATPSKVFAEGQNDIKVRVYNNGTNPITSFAAAVSIRNFAYGQPAAGTITNTLNYNFAGNIAPGDSAILNLGQLNIPLYRNILKINITNLNAVSDDVPYNDSLQYDDYYAGLNGDYNFSNNYLPISPTLAFSRFDDLRQQLIKGGVYGPSSVRLVAGTHNYPLYLDSISNRGSLSPLLVTSANGDTATTIIDGGPNVAIKLWQASYVTISKLKLLSTSNNALIGGFNSQYITIEDCTIRGGSDWNPSSYTGAGIAISGNWQGMTSYTDSNYIIRRNNLSYSGAGMSITGSSISRVINNILIDSNIFINNKHFGFSQISVKNVTVKRNIITTNTTVPTYMGISCGSAYGNTLIEKNKIFIENDGTGIFTDEYYGGSYAITDSLKIYNNFVTTGKTGDGVGIDLAVRYKQVQVLHNSVLNRSTSINSGSFRYGINTFNNVRVELINNIFQNTGNGYCVYYRRNSANNQPNILLDHHNHLFTNGPAYGYVSTYIDYQTNPVTTYATIASLNADGYETNATTGDPLFISEVDLHTDGSVINNTGSLDVNAFVKKDIDEELRNVANPDRGADEFTPPDFGAVQLESPQSSCSHTATEAVKAWIKNFGSTARTNIPVAYRINNGTVVRDTVRQTINGGDSVLFTFTQTANLLSPIDYYFDVFSAYRADSLPSNDTLKQYLVATTPANNVLPYYTGFEGTSAGWYTGGQNSSFKWGVIFSGVIDSAANGNNAWKTNLTGPHKNNELSYLYSPCFDLSSVTTDPTLNFNLAYQLEDGVDKAWVEYSSNAGATWTKLGAQGEGLGWYNNAGNFWTGNNHLWHNAKHSLPISGLGDKSSVRVRIVMQSNATNVQDGIAIDDISIYTGANPPVSDGTYLGRTAVSTGSGTFTQVNDPLGNRIVEINDNGQNLGTITVDVNQNVGLAPTLYNGNSYLGRSFVIHVQNAPTAPVRVRLFFTQAEFNAWQLADPTIDQVRSIAVYKFSGVIEDFNLANNTTGTPLTIGSAQITKIPYLDGYFVEFSVSSFSEFWITKDPANIVLPVKFTSISARLISDEAALVKWSVQSEQNVSRYEVERSADGVSFSNVGAANYNLTANGNYNFTDRNLLNGINYYRVKQIDDNGRFLYSQVVNVVKSSSILVEVYPNPFANSFSIVTSSAKRGSLAVYDFAGRNVYKGLITATKTTINAVGWSTGSYVYKIVWEDGTSVSGKLIKQ